MIECDGETHDSPEATEGREGACHGKTREGRAKEGRGAESTQSSKRTSHR